MSRYLSVDLDLTQFNPRSRFLRSLFCALNLVKIPAPALEYNRLEGLRLRPFYF